ALLLEALRRGELDDAALAALAAGLGRRAAAELDALRLALADFDFPQAQRRLQTILATLDPETT
ncbi:hypothetical protein, partial [Janthinobacterium sp.]|uniref:hypothetical protein n=1 Tax=Janthinobacterium sp. TaxID=1871054 RepID=UPI00293D258E